MTVPVSFTFNSKPYTGHFENVNGMGPGEHWNLIVKGYNRGYLHKMAEGWSFTTHKDGYNWEWGAVFRKMIDDHLEGNK